MIYSLYISIAAILSTLAMSPSIQYWFERSSRYWLTQSSHPVSGVSVGVVWGAERLGWVTKISAVSVAVTSRRTGTAVAAGGIWGTLVIVSTAGLAAHQENRSGSSLSDISIKANLFNNRRNKIKVFRIVNVYTCMSILQEYKIYVRELKYTLWKKCFLLYESLWFSQLVLS